MVNKVLLTGAGLISRAVAKQCASTGSEVHILSRTKPKWLIDGVRHWTCDLTNPTNISNSLKEIGGTDEVRHMAALTAAYSGDQSINFEMTRNLLDVAGSHGITRFSFFSGTSIYDLSGTYREIEEGTPVSKELSLYLATKVREESLVTSQMQNALILRVSAPVGPGMPKHRLIPTLIRNASLAQQTTLTNPNRVQDYIHVDDVAQFSDSLSRGGHVGIFNVASGISYSDLQVAEIVSSEVGYRAYSMASDAESLKQAKWTISTSKLRSAIGDVHLRSLESSIRTFIDAGADTW